MFPLGVTYPFSSKMELYEPLRNILIYRWAPPYTIAVVVAYLFKISKRSK